MKKKTFPRAVAYAVCAIFALTTAALAQNVQVNHDSKDSKAPITQEKEPLVHFVLEAGYTSEYNFRGTNLMPESDGGFYYQGQATIPKVGPGSLTLGIYAIHQIGEARSDSWSTSEGGGGAGNVGSQDAAAGQDAITYARFPTTFQTHFHEIDLFVSYKFALGPIDVTLGNIGFLIHREAQTFETDVIPIGNPQFIWVHPPTLTRFRTVGPLPTVEDETFDRIYIRLSTSKIPHITPAIIYYQTIYNEGTQPTSPDRFFFALDNGVPALGIPPARPSVFPAPNNLRNEELGGYLEGRLNGNFPVGHWLDINPFGVIAYSFDDRTEPVAGTFAGRPFTGFNHAQAGLELVVHITPHIDFVPSATYSHHISDPPIGTDKNEFWGGFKVAVNLW